MKVFLALAILSVAGCGARACERSLIGTWKSDGQETMQFIKENSRLEHKAEDFLEALMGHMTLTFSKSDLYSVMPDLEVPVSGEKLPFAGFEERKPYKVLFCSASMIVFSSKRSFREDYEAITFNFVGPDTIWVYLGSTDPDIPDINGREYFQRVR